MKTNMDVRSLGERESNYTNSSVRQMRQTKSGYGKEMNSRGNGAIAAGLLAGASVGVLAGMLLAPKKGKDFRKQVSESASKLGTQASGLYSSGRDKISSWTGKGNKDASRGSTSGNTTTRTGSAPNTNITSNRDINNDPATSITM